MIPFPPRYTRHDRRFEGFARGGRYTENLIVRDERSQPDPRSSGACAFCANYENFLCRRKKLSSLLEGMFPGRKLPRVTDATTLRLS